MGDMDQKLKLRANSSSRAKKGLIKEVGIIFGKIKAYKCWCYTSFYLVFHLLFYLSHVLVVHDFGLAFASKVI